MSTRCLIGKKYDNGQVKYIYCHWDGYPSYVGKLLVDFYDDNNIEQLFALGDLSVLGRNPVGKKDGWENPDYSGEFCLTYKDRGEDTPAQIVNSVDAFLEIDAWQDYTYLLIDNIWYINQYDDKQFEVLEDIIYKGGLKMKVYYVLEDWCYEGDCGDSPRVTMFADEVRCHNYFSKRVKLAQENMEFLESDNIEEDYNNITFLEDDEGFYCLYEKSNFLTNHVEVRFGVQEI